MYFLVKLVRELFVLLKDMASENVRKLSSKEKCTK